MAKRDKVKVPPNDNRIAQAMLARNAMNLYLRIQKFLIAEKLTFGENVAFVKRLRGFSEAQFGPPASADLKTEYFYQVLKALQKARVLWIDADANKYHSHRQALSFELRALLDAEGINVWDDEYIRMNPVFETVFHTVSSNSPPSYTSKAKLVYDMVLNGHDIEMTMKQFLANIVDPS